MHKPLEGFTPHVEKYSFTKKLESQIRGIMGELDDEEWKNVETAIVELRNQIDKMEWFSFGPNSVSAMKNKQRWTELVLAPKDTEHQQQLEQLLEYLGIYPWSEMRGNVPVLVVEQPRDMHLLREALLFEYLKDRMKGEGRAAEMEEWVNRKRRARREAREKELDEEREYMLRIERDRQDFANRKKEREREIVEYLQSLPVADTFEAPAALQRDRYYQFSFKPVGREVGGTKGKRAAPEVASPVLGEETPDLDLDLAVIEQEFDAGRINEAEIDKDLIARSIARGNRHPNLALFPKKYRMESPGGTKKKMIQEIETGKFITPKEEMERVRIAHDGFQEDSTKEEREAAEKMFVELSLMYRGLVLYMMREIVRRYGDTDPDNLFQAGLRGMFRSLQRHDPSLGSRYVSYLMPYMEGYMRREIAETRFSPVQVPVHSADARARLHEAREALRSQNPDKAVSEEDVARVLRDQSLISGESMAAYERYVRKSFMKFSLEKDDVLEDISLHDVDMRGEDLFAVNAGEAGAETKELGEMLTEVFSKLSPREERVLRMRYGFNERPGSVTETVYREFGAEYLPGRSLEEVKARVQKLVEDAGGPLTRDDVYQNLSLEDQRLAAGYIAALERHVPYKTNDDDSLDEVGAQFNVTKERIRQMEMKALRKLKHPSRTRALRAFLPENSALAPSWQPSWPQSEKKSTQVYDQGWRDQRMDRNRSDKKKKKEEKK